MAESKTTTKKASITPTTDAKGRKLSTAQQKKQRLIVDFNPESLQITLTNNIKGGKGNKTAQRVTSTTAKLSMELVFDSTLTGKDVREQTDRLASFMDPDKKRKWIKKSKKWKKYKMTSIVIFEWGSTKFEGYIDSYRETLDFFSSDGIPLRATVSLSITKQRREIELKAKDKTNPAQISFDAAGDANPAPIKDQSNMNDVARDAGDPEAARLIAELNGIENIRFPDVEAVVIPEEPGRGPVGFAISLPSVEAGEALTAGLGLSAGLSSTEAAFAGLQLQKSASVDRPRVKLSWPEEEPLDAELGIGLDTTFDIGGKVQGSSEAGMTADVGLDLDEEEFGGFGEA